mmetsp:Transcript_21757/g.37101  ORF Transcript_21757/g.37101 Transcript_21757/m.37101 type:complete len:322 (+) Transcript_21757:16-981(+)
MWQTTRLSKALAALLIAGWALVFFVPDTASYLALVPGRTLPCVWNVISGGLLIINPVELVINVIGLLILARLVEPVYGSKEFLKYLFLVNLMVCTSVFVSIYVAYAITTSGDLLYHQFTGFHGILAALLVAVKQIMPTHEVKLFGAVKLSVKTLPTLMLVIVCGICVALQRQDFLSFYCTGTYLGWVYLRFFQQQPESEAYGDASEQFKFSSFFPSFLEAPIDLLASILGFITRLRHDPATQAESTTKALHSGPSLLGSDAADASRRRERGAKALEERLGMKQGAGAEGARTEPSMRTAGTFYTSGGSAHDLEAGKGGALQ